MLFIHLKSHKVCGGLFCSLGWSRLNCKVDYVVRWTGSTTLGC